MQCPVCKVALVMTDRQGVEIDYCPQCRGVWLDRGELDKILERSRGGEATPGGERLREGPERRPEFRDRPEYRHHDRDHDDYHGVKRRRNWLEDLFD